MTSAVITPCSHFFHAGCLKKWLYVQETCPLCHSQLKSQSQPANPPHSDAPANHNPVEVGQGEPSPSAPVAPEGAGSALMADSPEQESPIGPASPFSSSSCSFSAVTSTFSPALSRVGECQEGSSHSEPSEADAPSPVEDQKCQGASQALAMSAGISA